MSKKLRYPVKNFNVTSFYGNRIHPITGQNAFHNGLDISTPQGSEVRAQADGVVNKVWISPAGGLQLRIDYKNGLSVGYAHLSAVDVGINQKVSTGQLIALTGGTPGTQGAGLSTGAHLHYTVKNKNGNYIDPLSIDYKPFRSTTALASMSFVPFRDPIGAILLLAAGLVANKLFRK